MKDTRPVNLDLTTIKFPLAAITSILHRISGVAIFLALLPALYLLDLSLQSEQGFQDAAALLRPGLARLLLWLLLAALFYHLIAGIKHLLMDFGLGETREGARSGAAIVLALSALAAVLAGVWLW